MKASLDDVCSSNQYSARCGRLRSLYVALHYQSGAHFSEHVPVTSIVVAHLHWVMGQRFHIIGTCCFGSESGGDPNLLAELMGLHLCDLGDHACVFDVCLPGEIARALEPNCAASIR